MATNITSNSNLYSTASSRRITGLASGLDTDEIVKNMVAAQKTKLSKAMQQKTLIDWQKQSYRTAITMLTEFQSKFLDVLNPSSIMRSSSLKALTTNIPEGSSKYLTVTSSNESLNSGFTVNSISNIATSKKIESKNKLSDSANIQVNDFDGSIDSIAGKSLSVTLDGVTKAISFDSDITKYKIDDGTGTDTLKTDFAKIAEDMQGKLDKAFGAGKVKINIEKNTEDTTNPNNAGYSFKFDTLNNGSTLKFTGSNIGNALIYFNNTNYLDTSRSISSVFGNELTADPNGEIKFSINDVEFNFNKNASFNEIMTKINQSTAGVRISYSSLNDKFSITANETGAGDTLRLADLSIVKKGATEAEDIISPTNFLSKIFGSETIVENSIDKIIIGVSTEGKDAVLNINGEDIIRSSNQFTLDGYSINLISATPQGETMNFSVSTKVDSTKTMDTIKQFVTGYNDLLTGLNSMLNEKRTKSYLPLTDEQKEEMSEKEIENWEATGKRGLLNGDPTLSRMVSSLRTALSSAVNFADGSGKTLASIGITTNKVGVDLSGKLVIDESKLKAAIEADPESVVKLFTNLSDIPKGEKITAENKSKYEAKGIMTDSDISKARFNSQGLAQRIAEIFNNNISTTYLSEGSLIKIAGTNGKNTLIDLNSRLGLKETEMDKTIAKIQKKLYEDEDKAYQRMAALEKAIASLNQQSTNLFSQ